MQRPAYLTTLEASYGPPSEAGFGSAVYFETGVASRELDKVALGTYRRFLGNAWTPTSETAWLSVWRRIYTRPVGTQRDVIAELRSLTSLDARTSVPMLLDVVEDAESARAALARTMDDPAVTDLAVYSIGDGGVLSGLLVAARRKNGEATLLVFLMD